MIQGPEGADPAALAFDAAKARRARGLDLLFVDTAGRLHTKQGLMEELKKVKRAIAKADPGEPGEVWLVLDAVTGQNGLEQAKRFHEAVGLTGVIVTKLDGTAKGGVLVPIVRTLKVPIRFIGVGEGPDDLQPFDAEAFVEALLEDLSARAWVSPKGTPEPGFGALAHEQPPKEPEVEPGHEERGPPGQGPVCWRPWSERPSTWPSPGWWPWWPPWAASTTPRCASSCPASSAGTSGSSCTPRR